MPTIDELSELVSDKGGFYAKKYSDKPIYYLSSDLTQRYSSFRPKSMINTSLLLKEHRL